MYFSVITKNLNWEILIKIQLLLKDEMGLRMKNLNIVMEDSMKNLTFKGGGSSWKTINILGGIAYKGGKKEGDIFEGGGGVIT